MDTRQGQEWAKAIDAVRLYLQRAFPPTSVETRPGKDSLGTDFLVNDGQGNRLYQTHLTRKLLDDTRNPEQLVSKLERWNLIPAMKQAGMSIVRVDEEGIH